MPDASACPTCHGRTPQICSNGVHYNPPAAPSTSDEDAHVRFLTNERTTLVARCEELYAALAAAEAEIAAQAATITELRAQVERTNGDYDKGWQAGHGVGYQDGHRDGSRT